MVTGAFTDFVGLSFQVIQNVTFQAAHADYAALTFCAMHNMDTALHNEVRIIPIGKGTCT